ncbi:MAG: hypothetical protein AAF191_06725 [Verrucomicrobiota bacterium]
MNRESLKLWLLGLFLALHSAGADEYRSFTGTNGKVIEARILSASATEATIEMKGGQQFTLPLAKFSGEDQIYIRNWSAKPPASQSLNGVTADMMNEAFGLDVFGTAALWEETDETVAERLGWKRESKTDFVSSYRTYLRKDTLYLGARPFTASMYADDGAVTSLSMVFANKGDSVSDSGEIKSLEEWMDRDVEIISSTLSELLGEGERQRFGDGAGRMTAIRWDWGSHAILLFEAPEEYVSLGIQPTVFADQGGKVDRVPETMLRKRVRENVERRDNGDVVVRNIPMVDQGPKGYCVPATYERCMRYLGVPADMYILAMTGDTSAGGGSSIQSMKDGAERDIRRKGRTIDQFSGELTTRAVAKYIDKGLPVMWTMYSTDPFNKIANERTKARLEVADWAAWASEIEEEAESRELEKDRNSAHITLIVGYNKDTGEIAFSDSWGERYLERWVTAKEAEEISQSAFQVVDF